MSNELSETKNIDKLDWKMPDNLQEKHLPKFPTQCMPDIIKNYIIGLSEELQVSEDMVGTAILGTLGLCNQGKYYVEAKKGWEESLNLYALIIANPSEKKSPVCKRITSSIYQYEKEKNESLKLEILKNKEEKQLLEKKIKDCKKNSKVGLSDLQKQLANFEELHPLKLIADDTTTEALATTMSQNSEKMAIVSAEGGIFSIMNGRYNNNIPNFDLYLKAYSKEPIKIDRKSSEDITMYNPLLTMVLFVQPIILEQVFSNPGFKGRGLCARFLYCYPASKVGFRKIDTKPIDGDTEKRYQNLIKKMISTEIKPTKLLLSENSYKIFIEYGEWLETQLLDDLEDMQDWAGKLQGSILRIAGNLHVAEYCNTQNTIIDSITLDKAIKLANYYLENAKKVYNIIGTNAEDIKAKQIIRKLKNKKIMGEIKRHDLYRICRGSGIIKIEDIIEPLNLLIEWNYIREKNIEISTNQVGRPSDVILELNPLFFDGK